MRYARLVTLILIAACSSNRSEHFPSGAITGAGPDAGRVCEYHLPLHDRRWGGLFHYAVSDVERHIVFNLLRTGLSRLC